MVSARTTADRDEVKRAKALSYIAEGRVRILHVDKTHVDALVRGTQPDPYVVARFQDQPFSCNCQAARGGRSICSHIVAVAMVVGPGHAPQAQALDPWAQAHDGTVPVPEGAPA